jgi:aconitate hydratase
VVARIVLQDFTGRAAAGRPGGDAVGGGRLGKNPKIIEPLVPVDLVVDHSVQVDFAGSVPRRWRRTWSWSSPATASATSS